jgi:hypothetical protein
VRRETRLLAGLGAIALVGVGALAYLAEQYEKRATTPVVREEGPSRAAHLVASFLAVGGGPAPSGEVLERAGISPDDYALVRADAVSWAAGGPVTEPALKDALDARGGEVRAVLVR